MIASVLAFSIFFTAPQPAPYLFPNEAKARTYASEDECMAGIRDARTQQAPILQAVASVDQTVAATLKTRYDSLVCKKGGPEELAEPAKDTEQEYLVRYKIGRYDGDQVFHGTNYNDTSYSSMADCQSAFERTKVEVMNKVLAQGVDNETAKLYVIKFTMGYACYERHLDANEPKDPPPAPTKLDAQTPAAQPPQVALQEPHSEAPTPYPVQPLTLPKIPDMKPTRGYRMAEYILDPARGSHWVLYAGVFYSPMQCWEQVRGFVKDEQERVQSQFQSMAVNYNASEWYRTQMLAVELRRKHLSCVIAPTSEGVNQ